MAKKITLVYDDDELTAYFDGNPEPFSPREFRRGTLTQGPSRLKLY
jgi:hypothetical protein